MPIYSRGRFKEISALLIAYSTLFFFLQFYCLQEQAKKPSPLKWKCLWKQAIYRKCKIMMKERKESEVVWPLQEHQEHTIFALHILLSSIANKIWISTCTKRKVGRRIVKNEGHDVCRIYSKIILLPFQKVAIKTHAMSFSKAFLKLHLSAVSEQLWRKMCSVTHHNQCYCISPEAL